VPKITRKVLRENVESNGVHYATLHDELDTAAAAAAPATTAAAATRTEITTATAIHAAISNAAAAIAKIVLVALMPTATLS